MKKIFIAVFALLSLAPLNALTLNEVLENKTLAKEIKASLQEQVKANKDNYTIAGLLYIGPATLVRTNYSRFFSLTQNKGYIIYNLNTDSSFNSYTLEIDYGNNDKVADPHRTNTYNVILKLFKDNRLVVEHLAGIIELENAGANSEGVFYTNLAVNASFINGKFYVLDKEPDTCGKQFDIKGTKIFKPTYQTDVNHKADCKDPNHCSCPKEQILTQSFSLMTEKSFAIETEACKTDKNCKCPVYIAYED